MAKTDVKTTKNKLKTAENNFYGVFLFNLYIFCESMIDCELSRIKLTIKRYNLLFVIIFHKTPELIFQNLTNFNDNFVLN